LDDRQLDSYTYVGELLATVLTSERQTVEALELFRYRHVRQPAKRYLRSVGCPGRSAAAVRVSRRAMRHIGCFTGEALANPAARGPGLAGNTQL
jgi:hypothetical protein